MDPFYQLWFAVRYAHVAAAAILIGGAVLVAALSLEQQHDAAIAAAMTYEWTFWIVIIVSVVSGVSNLGLKGDGLLGPETGWGRALTAKLTAVLLLLVLSLARTGFVARSPRARLVERRTLVIRILHGATAVMLVVVLWIGLGLAHGRY